VSTQKEAVEFILTTLGHDILFTARAMFGEYALYVDGKVVALICDNQLYVKITDASKELEMLCDKDSPYPGAKPHYLVEEDQLTKIVQLPEILLTTAHLIPKPKKKVKKVLL
jgi:TfoX/Sxy family transcriptional regulator of competence genes